jgi:putative YhdH/YhfP family quinone oxidoreductase
MIYGTAGYTAAYSVQKLEHLGVSPDKGEVLVTGATGGVGSVAVAILAKMGYLVVASTGKADQADFLKALGAKEVISREESLDESGRPLLKARWAGVVDTVGGEILATAIKSTNPRGVVTCCGNVASAELPINVYPFILRGVSLVGIDSQDSPIDQRKSIWDRIATDWKLDTLDQLTKEITLNELDSNIELILQGKQRGRVLVNLEN